MTPKQKALDLCQQFGRSTLFAEDCNEGITLPLRIAKICALIAVNEIDAAIDFEWMEVQNLDRQHNYWNEVKSEIEKL